MDNSRIAAFTNIFRELANTSGLYERTRIVPNLIVVNITPTGLSSDYILIQDDEGFYVPALKVPGITYAVNDKVNVLFIKGTEPIAFQHGTESSGGGGGGGGGWPFDHIITVSSTNADADYSTLTDAYNAASDGDAILLDSEQYDESLTISKQVTIFSIGNKAQITNDAAATLTADASGIILINVEVINTSSGATGYALDLQSVTTFYAFESNFLALDGTTRAGVKAAAPTFVQFHDCQLSGVLGSASYGLYITSNASIKLYNSILAGNTADIKSTAANPSIYFYNSQLSNSTIDFSNGRPKGHVYNATGDFLTLETSGRSGGVWRHKADGLRYKEVDLNTAYTNAGTGDVIRLYAGTYTLAASLTVAKIITIEGDNPSTTIITCDVDSTQTLNITADGVTLRNLTVIETGDGITTSAIAWDGDNLTLENVIATKTSGAANLHVALFQYGGTGARLLNVFATASGGATNSYGYYNALANASAEVFGGKISGTSFDIFSAEAGSTLVVNGASLDNNKISYLGTIVLFGIRGAAFVAHKNGTDQTGIVSGVWTKLTFGTELFDRNGDYDAGNSKHLPLIPGNYNYTAAALLVAPTDQASIFIAIYKNGTLERADSRNASGTSNMSVSITAMVKMNGTTDYVEAYIWHNVGVNKTVTGNDDYTYFQGNLVQ